jgi:hypothetical protein
VKTLKLADELALPLTAVTEKLAWLGRTGSGKTYAAMKLAELMLGAGAQVGAIDPVGVWRALRVPAEKGGPSRAFRSDVALEAPVDGAVYGTGADWAKKVNHTVIVTIRKDVRPIRVAAVKHPQREPSFSASCRCAPRCRSRPAPRPPGRDRSGRPPDWPPASWRPDRSPSAEA